MTKILRNKFIKELNINRRWKAKELLQGAIASSPYDNELYYEYAKILYSLEDYVESGKYFLLTDSHEPNYQNAINVFLQRHKQENYFSHFPRQFKKVAIKDYPNNLLNLVDNNFLLKEQIEKYQKYSLQVKETTTDTYKDKLYGILFLFFITFLFIIFLLGCTVIIKFLWSLL